jgi:rhodanese-related sulfurtransferase
MKTGFIFLVLLTAMTVSAAVTPEELNRRMNSGESLTLIDVRPTLDFAQGHIPGAINIPANALASRRLPPLGEAVIYSEGLGRLDEERVLEELNRKPGIRAEILSGGLAAWESVNLPTTAPKGLSRQEVPVITYQQLLSANPREMLLVDLRGGEEGRAAATDLRALLPHARLHRPSLGLEQTGRRSPPDAGSARRERQAGLVRDPVVQRANPASYLIILIDDGDGSAVEAAEALRSQGNRRVVVLAGGEDILRRGGRSGLERSGSSITFEAGEVPDLRAGFGQDREGEKR